MSLCLVVVSCNFKSWRKENRINIRASVSKSKCYTWKEYFFFRQFKKIKSKCWIFDCVAPLWTKSFQTELTSMQRKSTLPPCLVFSSIVSAVRLILQCANFARLCRSNVQRYIFCVCANVEILHLLQLQIKSQPIVWASYSAFPPISTLPNSFAPATDVLFTHLHISIDSESVFVFQHIFFFLVKTNKRNKSHC